jgi:hypothetical protein
MDTSFFLLLAASAFFLIYIGTLMLNVHFRGDFGIITDLSVRKVRNRAFKSTGEYQENLMDLFFVPLDDLNLLFFPFSSGYNSRMSHMNFKEG